VTVSETVMAFKVVAVVTGDDNSGNKSFESCAKKVKKRIIHSIPDKS
jgi:hypothetical protein